MLSNTTFKSLDLINEELLSSLNPEQYEAVTSVGRPLLVLSGAGTGKTKVLTTKIAYLIENGYAFSAQILAVTFSNRAAREMKERLFELTDGARAIWLGTFHSICVRILRKHAELVGISRDFSIVDADDQLKLIKQIFKEKGLDKKNINSTVNDINLWKDKAYSCTDKALDPTLLSVQVYKIYQERLRCYDSVDFGDLMLYVLQIFRNYPQVLQQYRSQFKYILVDEYQDTNLIQYYWLRMLSPVGDGLCCVGDDDQSIYSWRGAEVEHILRFEKDFPNAHIVRLERNYRSGGHILAAASQLIANNEDRLGKTIWSEGEVGEKVKIREAIDGEEEAMFVAKKIDALKDQDHSEYKSMAVLVRAGYQTREFEDAFMHCQIPYKVIGGLKFYDRQEIKDIVAYLRLIYQSNDSLAFERIINVPKRGIGASTVSLFYNYAREKNISLYQAVKEMLPTEKLRPSVQKALTNFVNLIDSLQAKKDMAPFKIAEEVIERTGYLKMLQQDKDSDATARIDNIKELISALQSFHDLQSFIEHVSLVMDSPKQDEKDFVSIMTLHGAKGLEFDNVFLVGWEEGIFPSGRCNTDSEFEEERRLAYVGLTRAKKRVFVSFALRRKLFGYWQDSIASTFVEELPRDHYEII